MCMPYTSTIVAVARTTATTRTSAAARPERRGRTGRPEVLRAACTVLDRSGEQGLTMASVAQELGLTTMALYRHVASRAELIAGAADLVLGESTTAAPEDRSDNWIERVSAWMVDVRTVLVAHPWLGAQLGAEGSVATGWLRAVARLVRELDRSPLDAADQARALVWITRSTMGIVSQEVRAPLPDAAADPDAWLPMIDETDRQLVRAAMRQVRAVDNDELFTTLLAQTHRYLQCLAPPA
jgi:AcrR family transcriptional regulator